MKKILLILTLLISSCISLIAQDQMPYLIVGVEASGRTSYLFDDLNTKSLTALEYGINFERPVFNKFSIGVGINQSVSGTYSNNTQIGNEVFDEGDPEQYLPYREDRFRLRSTSIPIRLIYRLQCNCIFFHASFISEFSKSEYISSREKLIRPYPHLPVYQTLNKQNPSVEFGVGFKLHFSEKYRIFFRPEYKRYLNPQFNYETKKISRQFMKVTFGVQRALFAKQEKPAEILE